MTLTTYSQTTVLNKNGDTSVCFSVKQTKFLLKKYYEVEKFRQLDSICEAQRALCDSVVQSKQIVTQKQEIIITNQKEIIDLKQYEIARLTEQLKIEKKNVRKQKTYKWISIGVGTLASGFLGFKLLGK